MVLPIEERFARNVQKTATCSLWTAHCVRDGYGSIRFRGRETGAHRVAYELFVGPIPPGLDVLHACDTPPCVRPDHLFLGTQLDNVRDMFAKGRNRTIASELHHSAKLTVEHVREIRRLHASGIARRELARRFAVRPSSIWKILRGKSWRGVS